MHFLVMMNWWFNQSLQPSFLCVLLSLNHQIIKSSSCSYTCLPSCCSIYSFMLSSCTRPLPHFSTHSQHLHSIFHFILFIQLPVLENLVCALPWVFSHALILLSSLCCLHLLHSLEKLMSEGLHLCLSPGNWSRSKQVSVEEQWCLCLQYPIRWEVSEGCQNRLNQLESLLRDWAHDLRVIRYWS